MQSRGWLLLLAVALGLVVVNQRAAHPAGVPAITRVSSNCGCGH
jgi:hypothetical protein